MESVRRHVEVAGNVLQDQKAAISPSVPGTILQVLKEEGDSVQEGEKLVILDTKDFDLAVEQARAGLRAARAGRAASQATLANVEVQYRRFDELHDQAAVAQAEFESVETGYKAAQAGFKAAVAQVSLAEVGLKTARKMRSDTVAVAPFDGFVTQRFMDPGERNRVMPPTMVLVVMDIDPVKAEGQVAERNAPDVREGATVQVNVDSLPGRRFEGIVEAVVPFVDPATRTVKIRVRIPNQDFILKPGMAATLRIDLGERDVLLIPREAVVAHPTPGEADVLVVDSEDRVDPRRITVGESMLGIDVKVFDGLDAGDRVIVAGIDGLSKGQKVDVADSPLQAPARKLKTDEAEAGR